MKVFAILPPGTMPRAAVGAVPTVFSLTSAAITSSSSLEAMNGRATSSRYLQTHSSHIDSMADAQRPLTSTIPHKVRDPPLNSWPGASSSSLQSDFFSPRPPLAMIKGPRQAVSFNPTTSSRTSAPSSQPPSGQSQDISDHEFEVRLGRAVSLLRATLSDFMRIGLVDYDTSHVSGASTSSGLGFPSLDRLGLGVILNIFGATAQAKARQRESLPPHLRDNADCPVYHNNIVFKFRPPVTNTDTKDSQDSSSVQSSSGDVNQATLMTFSGRPMYFGSAHILRHALSALFSETTVLIEKVKLQRGPSDCSANDGKLDNSGQQSDGKAKSGASREATLLLRLTFTGVVRVTQQVHDYTVIFKYKFDPKSGMIIEHEVDKIEPAPGKKIWAGLSSAFSRLAGFQQPAPSPSPYHQTNRMLPNVDPTWKRDHFAKPSDTTEAFAPLSLREASSSAANVRYNGPQCPRRRFYSSHPGSFTSSPPAPVEPIATQNTSQQSFFRRPRSAEDMPGPSLASIWMPSLVPSCPRDPPTNVAQGLNLWAPPSNDPAIVAPAVHEGFPQADLIQYRHVAAIGLRSIPKIIAGLSKSNLTFLVTLTGMAGYALCPSLLAVSSAASFLGPVGTLLALATGTALCSGAANAINQLREIPYDAQMARTRNRLLPSRVITPLQAATFAGISTVGGVATLATLNPLTAFLGLSNIFLYAFVYTPMKRRHIANTWVGAIVGALPPLMGWAACTGTLHLATDAPAWCLAALLFAWQFPHFNSLSHNLSSEYARGGYRMMSVVDPALNRRTSLRYALALIPICSLALPLSGAVAPIPYAVLSLPANLIMVQAAWKFWRKGTEKSARWCFWVSLIHLPVVMILAMATKKSLWDAVVDWINGVETEREAEAGEVAAVHR